MESNDVAEATTAFNNYAFHKTYPTYSDDAIPFLYVNSFGVEWFS